MKSVAIVIVAPLALSLSAFAGQPLSEPYQSPKNPMPEGCFGETEWQLDTFALLGNHRGDTGWGGGLAVNYFFHRYWGVGAEASMAATESEAWVYGAHFLLRYPTELGPFCLSPYLKFSAGVTDNDSAAGYVGVGGGFEVRMTHDWGVFGETSYHWAAADQDFAQMRAGIRWVF